MVSVSVSIFDTKDKSLSISLNFWDQLIKSQSQNVIPILKVSVSVSKIETVHTESQFPCLSGKHFPISWGNVSLLVGETFPYYLGKDFPVGRICWFWYCCPGVTQNFWFYHFFKVFYLLMWPLIWLDCFKKYLHA